MLLHAHFYTRTILHFKVYVNKTKLVPDVEVRLMSRHITGKYHLSTAIFTYQLESF